MRIPRIAGVGPSRLFRDRRIPLIGTTCILLTLLLAPYSSAAGPLLDAAFQAADRIVLVPACAAASEQGEAAAAVRESRRLWTLGGLANGLLVFFVPLQPLMAHTTSAAPPEEILAGTDPATLDCFSNGYERGAKRLRKRSAWTGWGIGTAIIMTWVMATLERT